MRWEVWGRADVRLRVRPPTQHLAQQGFVPGLSVENEMVIPLELDRDMLLVRPIELRPGQEAREQERCESVLGLTTEAELLRSRGVITDAGHSV